jgi:hypothetical protein
MVRQILKKHGCLQAALSLNLRAILIEAILRAVTFAEYTVSPCPFDQARMFFLGLRRK